jgi:hypothetical protein
MKSLPQTHLDVAGGADVGADVAADALAVVGVHVAPVVDWFFLTLNTAVCGQYTTQLSHSKHWPQLMQRLASATAWASSSGHQAFLEVAQRLLLAVSVTMWRRLRGCIEVAEEQLLVRMT